jgi:hypothetical protein
MTQTRKTPSKKGAGKAHTNKNLSGGKSSDAYGEKVPICANIGCVLRKKAKCFGFEGCPGFQAR